MCFAVRRVRQCPMGKGCDMDEEPYRWVSMRSGLDRSTFDAHARPGLRLRTSRGLVRGLVHVLVGAQGDQEHQGDVAQRAKRAVPASSANPSAGTGLSAWRVL